MASIHSMNDYYMGRKKDVLKTSKREGDVFSLFLFLLMGVLIGSVYSLLTSNGLGNIVESANTAIVQKSSGNLRFMFQYTFWENIKYVGFLLVFASSPVGVVATTGILFYKGLHIGVLTAILYTSLGLKGILMNLLLFLPGSVISAFCLLHIGKHVSSYAKQVFTVMFKSEKVDFLEETRNLLKRVGKISIAFCLMSLPEIGFSFLISGLF